MSWKDTALQHAKKDAPYEACGLLAIHKGKEKCQTTKRKRKHLMDTTKSQLSKQRKRKRKSIN